ncbi:hypothetical protein AAZX31_05G071700 [Glycine max]
MLLVNQVKLSNRLFRVIQRKLISTLRIKNKSIFTCFILMRM